MAAPGRGLWYRSITQNAKAGAAQYYKPLCLEDSVDYHREFSDFNEV